MNIRKPIIYIGMILLLFVVLDMGFHWKSSSGDVMMETIKVQDSTGEFVTIPKHPKRVVCSGGTRSGGWYTDYVYYE